jgi:hypothetical protein
MMARLNLGDTVTFGTLRVTAHGGVFAGHASPDSRAIALASWNSSALRAFAMAADRAGDA